MLQTSHLTQKGQATIPAQVRNLLHLKAGDTVAFEIEKDRVFIRKAEPLDIHYAKALSSTLSDEWLSDDDGEAYDHLL